MSKFWSDPNVEPLRAYRFLISLKQNEKEIIPSFQFQSFKHSLNDQLILKVIAIEHSFKETYQLLEDAIKREDHFDLNIKFLSQKQQEICEKTFKNICLEACHISMDYSSDVPSIFTLSFSLK